MPMPGSVELAWLAHACLTGSLNLMAWMAMTGGWQGDACERPAPILVFIPDVFYMTWTINEDEVVPSSNAPHPTPFISL
jgi:hypothetical protein